jgi:hypothetical protein
MAGYVISSSGDRGFGGQTREMAADDDTTRSSDDENRSMRRLLERLTAATKRRRRLGRGTPAYARALEAEERLARGIWRSVSVGSELGEPVSRPVEGPRDGLDGR